MSLLPYRCFEVSGADSLSDTNVFSATRKNTLNAPWVFACVWILRAMVFNSTTKRAPDSNDGAFSSPWPGNKIAVLSVSRAWLVGKI